jgi:hypothetical protein
LQLQRTTCSLPSAALTGNRRCTPLGPPSGLASAARAWLVSYQWLPRGRAGGRAYPCRPPCSCQQGNPVTGDSSERGNQLALVRTGMPCAPKECPSVP